MLIRLLAKRNIVRRPTLYLDAKFTSTSAEDYSGTWDDSDAYVTRSHILTDEDLLRRTNPDSNSLYVLDLIKNGSLEPDATLYNKLIKKCTQFGKLKEAQMIHAHLIDNENNFEFRNNLIIQTGIVNMYAKFNLLEEAEKVFDEMRDRNTVTWTALITGFAQNDRGNDALGLFPEMVRSGLKPNQFTFASLLKACGARPSDREGRMVHGVSKKFGYCGDVYVGTALVDMYARCGEMSDAISVFIGLVVKNEVSWNTLIAGHARRDEAELAVKVFWMMQREGYEATSSTYSSVFTACAKTGSLELGKWVHAHMIKSGGRLTAFLGNTLVDMYAKAGSIEDAQNIFDRLIKPDVVSWNSMLTGYAQHGLGKEAVRQFEVMLRSGIQPNEVTFLCVLTACSHSGLLGEGRHHFDLMKKFNVEPNVSHYVTMVDLLGRAGLLDRAEKFIREIPIQPTAAVWGALLGACRMHKNMELGAYAAERVFELDPHDSGPHIILCNIYAAAGRLDDAAKVRKMMKESGVKKEPACSWVEIENATHVFVANDTFHPQREQVFRMWEEIGEKIREIGYVPDSSHVLLVVDEQEREAKLQYHSEKLALAFALLNSPPGSTIRIKKNIRVCGDCHSAFKFVSKLFQREIIVRDKNRFHHFRNGSCTCGDYW